MLDCTIAPNKYDRVKKAQIGFTAHYSTGLAAYVYTHTISEKKESIHRKCRTELRGDGGGGGGGGERAKPLGLLSPLLPSSQFSMFYTQEMAFLKPGGMGEGVSGGWINEWRGARAQGPWGPFQTAVPTAGQLSTGHCPSRGKGERRESERRASK